MFYECSPREFYKLIKMKLRIILIMLSLLFIPLVSGASDDLLFATNKQYDLKIPCINNGTYCSTVAECNVTITYPDGNLLKDNVVMTNQGSFHNLTILFSENNQSGPYPSTAVCCDSGDCGEDSFTIQITKSGTILETSESLIFILLTLAIFVFFSLSFFFAIATPYGNETNETGMVLQVTKLKYVKLLFIMLTYILFIWFLNALVGVSENFVSLTLFSGFIGFLFELMNRLAWPFGIFIIILSFFEVIRDANFTRNTKDLMGVATRT